MSKTLPPLPEWSKMDNLGGLVPSEIRQELRAYALAAIEAQGMPNWFWPMARRRVFDYIRGAYDLGYNDARNARTIPGDGAHGYKGRDVEADHGGALLHALEALASAPPAPPIPQGHQVDYRDLPNDELPGMWDQSDFIGGATDCEPAPQAEDWETRAELAEQAVVRLSEERDHFKALYYALKEQSAVVQQEPVAWADERAIQWLADRAGIHVASITTKLSAVKSPERPMPIYTHPAPQAKPLTDEQKEVIAFLFGEAPLDGVWFGDNHFERHGKYWWRHHLANAFRPDGRIKGE